MGWKKDAEHWRDYGHTWGPGFEKEDFIELSEEEQAAEVRRRIEYEKEIETGRVQPREKYAWAGQEMKKILPTGHDITFGLAPAGWREAYSKAKLQLCEQACQELGYSLVLRDRGNEDKNGLIVGVESYGYMPDRGGNIHQYAVSGIYNVDDCLQLVADFRAIGMRPTTHFKEHHISLNDTGELRREMKSWNIDFVKKPASLDNVIAGAADIAWKQKTSLPSKASRRGDDSSPFTNDKNNSDLIDR